MFIARNVVRMHDTDMAGLLYFPRQFRFAHDALEDFMHSIGYNYDQLFRLGNFVFVVVHAEASYFVPLNVADELEVHVSIRHIGTTAFTIFFEIYKKDKTLAGTATTVHVTLNNPEREKVPIPAEFRHLLEKHLQPI